MPAGGWLDEMARSWNGALHDRPYRGPGYVYDASAVARRYRELSESVGPRVEVLASVKANPCAPLIERLVAMGAGLDLGSESDLAFVDRERRKQEDHYTSLVGPGKSAHLLRRAVEAGCSQLVLESVSEVRALADVLGGVDGWSPRILLRVNPSSSVPGQETMGGVPSQFGIDADEVGAVLDEAQTLGVRVSGYHYFLASQVRDLDAIATNIAIGVDDAAERGADGLHPPFTISLGGGIGVPLEIDHRPVDLAAVGAICRAAVAELDQRTGVAVDAQFEAGRILFAEAGVYLCQVLETKFSYGGRFAIVDGGVAGFTRPVLPWGEPHPIWRLGSDPAASGGVVTDVVGPSCLPGDRIAVGALLPEDLTAGDVLAVGNAGAYGRAMSLGAWGRSEPVAEEVIG